MKMGIHVLVWSYLKAKKLSTLVNIFLLALGVSMITSLLLFRNYLGDKITANTSGIDLVVGAKGSPLQLILCNIFHADFPTGNIKLKDVDPIVSHPLVKNAIPLSLGDSYEGFRIVGTTEDYSRLYKAELAEGAWYGNEMEAVIGARVASAANLGLGSVFNSTHGLVSDGHDHSEQFVVTGIMEKTNKVVDDLIFTSLQSVWSVHDSHDQHDADEGNDEVIANPYKIAPMIDKQDTTTEITSVLIQFRNPVAALQLPRYINAETKLQAASPAFEAARLFSILGVGLDTLRALSVIIILIAALSIFIALYNSLSERQYDLAIMRTLGASRLRLFLSVTLEGCLLTFSGCVLGIFLGHLLLNLMPLLFDVELGFNSWRLLGEEMIMLAFSLLMGIACSVIPAIKAYQINIHKVLANG